jgi:hypothetical protein
VLRRRRRKENKDGGRGKQQRRTRPDVEGGSRGRRLAVKEDERQLGWFDNFEYGNQRRASHGPSREGGSAVEAGTDMVTTWEAGEAEAGPTGEAEGAREPGEAMAALVAITSDTLHR